MSPTPTNRPTIDEQRDFYDRWNAECRAGGFDDISPEIRSRGKRVVELIRSLDLVAPRTLEVGCGTGWLTEKLAELGRVTAIDLSPRAIELARARGLDVKLIAGDFLQHDFGATVIADVSVCVETLFYVEDQPRCVRLLAALTEPGGYLLVTTINKFVYDRRRDVGPPEPGQIRRWLTRTETLRLLERHFDILSVETMQPMGDQGVLRVVNSHKLNALLGRIGLAGVVKRAKEKLGLGGGIVILARKRC